MSDLTFSRDISVIAQQTVPKLKKKNNKRGWNALLSPPCQILNTKLPPGTDELHNFSFN